MDIINETSVYSIGLNKTAATAATTETTSTKSGPDMLRLVLYLPLLIIATVGNFLSFVIMRRKSMRQTSPGIYFAAMACADTSTVYWGLIPFIVRYFSAVDLWTLHPWSCRIVIFALFTSSDTAVWLLTAVTVDRFIAVRFPMKRKQLCTPRNALIVTCVLTIVAMMKNFHLFFTRGRQVTQDPELPQEEWIVDNCGFLTPEIEFFETYIRTWIAFSLYAFIPIGTVLISNILIVVTLWKVRKVGPVSSTTDSARAAQSSQQQERARKSNNQLTAMFLSVSITFLVLTIPSITVLLIKPYLNLNKEQAHKYAYLEGVVDSMAYLMHSMNFFLYCLTGPGFRREFKFIIDKWFLRNNIEENSVTENTVGTN